MRIARALLIAGALAGAVAARAAEPPPPPGGGFVLPIDCLPGRTCWVMNYPDMDPGPRAADPACGPRTYDGHKGTDIAIRDRAFDGALHRHLLFDDFAVDGEPVIALLAEFQIEDRFPGDFHAENFAKPGAGQPVDHVDRLLARIQNADARQKRRNCRRVDARLAAAAP